MLCCAVLRCAVLFCAVLCCAVLCCAVLCCAVLRCAVLCCAEQCCAVLCCAMLSGVVLHCTAPLHKNRGKTQPASQNKTKEDNNTPHRHDYQTRNKLSQQNTQSKFVSKTTRQLTALSVPVARLCFIAANSMVAMLSNGFRTT